MTKLEKETEKVKAIIEKHKDGIGKNAVHNRTGRESKIIDFKAVLGNNSEYFIYVFLQNDGIGEEAFPISLYEFSLNYIVK